MSSIPCETIKVQSIGKIGVISLNRPEVLNAINAKMVSEINQTLDAWEEDDNIRVIVLTSGERGFCAGADLKESRGRSLKQQIAFLRSLTDLISRFEELPKPIVAAINGRALGGGLEVILGCDMIIATENSTFGLPEIHHAVMPAAGGTQRLPRIVGRLRAKEMLLIGRSINAVTAEKYGLLNRVVPSEVALVEAYTEVGNELGEMAPIAVMQIKRLVNTGTDMPLHLALELAHEAGTLIDTSEDRKEGLKAFAEKRKPQFKGV